MADFADRLAEAVGDANALLRLALELMQANAKLEAEAAVLAERRQRDAARKRRPRNSTDIHGTDGNSQDERGNPGDSSPPAPSPSFPTPHITPSSPPSPASAAATAGGGDVSASGETDDEARFYRELASPTFAAIATRFLAGKSATARIAWVGRFRGAMSKPPHPTAAELADALEDLMANERPENWAPTLFRTYVGRIRRDAAREAERNSQASQPARAAAARAAIDHVAEAAWQLTLTLLPRWQRREVTAATFAEMQPAMRSAISAIGGFQQLATTPDDRRVWLKKDFLAAYQRAANDQRPEAQSA